MRKNLKTLTRCLRVNQTLWENKLWYYLRGKRLEGLKFKRQVPIDRYIVDFLCQEKKFIIELDGGHHNEPETAANDLKKRSYLESKGYEVVNIWNNELDNNIEGVLEKIRHCLTSPGLRPPSP